MTQTTGDPERRPARTPTQRGMWWVGVILITAGVVMLAYVGWQMWGTNIISKKHHRALVSQAEQEWQAGTALEPRYVPEGDVSALVRIPKFGSDYVVPVLEGTTTDVLARGFGHFTQTANPGEVGNYAISGHRVTHGEPLRRMPELVPGDEIIIETGTARYTYVLDTDPNDLIVPFTGVWVVDELPKNPTPGGVQPRQEPDQRLITLTTCSEIFHTSDRMIAFGHLVEKTNKRTGKVTRF